MQKPVFHKYDCNICLQSSPALLERIHSLQEQDYVQRSHFFDGRYENIYVARENLPEIEQILQVALQQAAQLLGQPADELRLGFWLNIMQAGHTTTRHTHDDSDELLSGVYYLCAPENSGDLVLWSGKEEIRLAPVEGRFVFFSPGLPHAVSRHQGSGARISIAFNIGPQLADN